MKIRKRTRRLLKKFIIAEIVTILAVALIFEYFFKKEQQMHEKEIEDLNATIQELTNVQIQKDMAFKEELDAVKQDFENLQENFDDFVKQQELQEDEFQEKLDVFSKVLSKIIYAEAGNCDDLHQQYVAYVALNRRDSKYFKGSTLEGIFLNFGGYADTSTDKYREGEYSEQSLKNARIVAEQYLTGNMPVSPALVYQAEFKQGVNSFKMGNTYFGYDQRILNDLANDN